MTGMNKCRKFFSLVLVVSIIIVYANAVHTAFIYDDIGILKKNTVIRYMSNLSDISEIFSAPAVSCTAGRPLANFSFAINYAAGGQEPEIYKTTNILVHILTAVALYYLLLNFLSHRHMSNQLRLHAFGISALASLLWALHPINTNAVTYVTQRMESMMTLFFLCSITCALKGWENPGRIKLWHLLSVLCAFISSGFKEVAGMILPVLLLIDLRYLYPEIKWREKLKRSWGLYTGNMLVFLYIVIYQIAIGNRGGVAKKPLMSSIEYLFAQGRVILHYLKLSFYPSGFQFAYFERYFSISQTWPYALALFLLFMAVIWLCIKRNPAGLAGAIFFIVLAPTSSFIPNYYPVTEYRMYLPLALLSVLFSAFIFRIYDRINKNRPLAFCLIGLAILSSGFLGYLTISRNRLFKDPKDVWLDTYHTNPANLGAVYCAIECFCKEGDFDNAEKLFRHLSKFTVNVNEEDILESDILGKAIEKLTEQVIKMDMPVKASEFIEVGKARIPEHSFIYLAEAMVAFKNGDIKKADELCYQGRQYPPGNAKLYDLNGMILQMQGNYKEALIMFEAALILDPYLVSAWLHQGNCQVAFGEYKAAANSFLYACSYSRSEWEPLQNLGFALIQLGCYKDAEYYLVQAMELNPKEFNTLLTYGVTLCCLGKLQQARDILQKACAIDAGNPDALYYLGRCYYFLGQKNLAEEQLVAARKIMPELPDYE